MQQAAAILRVWGALLFGLSDNPDFASLSNEAQTKMGMKPLHRLETLAVGQAD